MAGKPGFRVLTEWQRVGNEALKAFDGASSAQIADSMMRLGAMDGGIRQVWSSPRVIGQAVTAWCHSADNLMLHKAINVAQAGDVIVVNTQGNRQNSAFGELLAISAVKKGIAAVIVDGTVRDADGLEALGLPVYSRGLSPSGCNKDGAGEVGTPIACGGVAVHAGDIIVADIDGVTVIPFADFDAVVELAAGQVKREENRKAEIEKGVLTRPEIDEALRRAKVID
jgi:4-hydroxy-4-methyl-2-oxoglutarate aldolase